MPDENYQTRFELKPGKWVFVQTKQSALDGKVIVEELLKKWQPATHYYHFGKRGGHLGALRAHSVCKFRASLDLKNFFSSVSRNKVSKSLKSIGFNQKDSFDIARRSCVEFGGKRFIPFGFIQSMALATLVIDRSRLGKTLDNLRSNGTFVSMYVDDLLISSNSETELSDIYEMLAREVLCAGFELAKEKCILPTESLDVFNCRVGEGTLSVTEKKNGGIPRSAFICE
ncbi:reverse transcriptase domain-containing protein [Sulfitobacter sp. F26169L]|uniref:reverse transcriptase domain-containing protein n=1 Tax=Sulfitobacter sp. F26169L TaxID=2996015 RepID=UPI002260B6D8|nr:reverse transcriptase domain-containing protein [Sulfitobacter sp. F26169L]MCX7564844.1 reverse transcriptase domain-containing protein [Sulfitobacter sp. F26169L]